jgi:hypothetical protein
MPKRNSSSQRTLKLFRSQGYICAVTERWNPFARVRQDLFGFIDILVISEWNGIIGLQVTNQGEVPAHVRKLNNCQAVNRWLRAGGGIKIVEWKTKPSKEGRRKFWHYRFWSHPFKIDGASEWRTF